MGQHTMNWLGRVATSILLVASATGCGTINYRNRLVLPPQNIDAAETNGGKRVIIFNSTRPSWITAGPTASIALEVDGKFAAIIRTSHYVQLFLESGDHSVKLEHFDIFSFTDIFNIKVGDGPLYVKLTRKFGSNKLEVVDELPIGFADDYRPAAP